MKKVFALVLVLAVLAAALPLPAAAEKGDGLLGSGVGGFAVAQYPDGKVITVGKGYIPVTLCGMIVLSGDVRFFSPDGAERKGGQEIMCGDRAELYNKENMLLDTAYISIRGDMNSDGKTSPSDARIALRIAAGLDTLDNPGCFAAGDINADLQIKAYDARQLLRMAAGLRVKTVEELAAEEAERKAQEERLKKEEEERQRLEQERKRFVICGADTGTTLTYTGFEPLPEVHSEVPDPYNSRGFSVKVQNYGFGVSSNGQPSYISVNNQNYFDTNGWKALALDLKTTDKRVVYLTFDCGYDNGNTAKILDALAEKQVKAVFFCTLVMVKQCPELIVRMIKEGHIVGNHSARHSNFAKISRTAMTADIEDFDNYMRVHFGYSSKLFRFPEGAYSESALNLVQELGYYTVFWSEAYDDWYRDRIRGANYALNIVTSRLHPGAVILLHAVSADNAAAMRSIVDSVRAAGYEFVNIPDYPF